MRVLLASLCAFCLTSVCAAADFDPFAGPKPLAVFIQTNPWLKIIGSDTPLVAIYDNGDVIFRRDVKGSFVQHQVTVSKDQLEQIREKLKPVLALKDLKRAYNLQPGWSDQPEALFYVRNDQRELATSVYGLIPVNTSSTRYAFVRSAPVADRPPYELLALHKWLYELDYANSKVWTPKFVEVMLWDYSYAPDASIHWPQAWPSLKSERTIMRGDDYSIFLDGESLPQLRQFLATRKPRGAVEVEGKKLAAAYRFTYPGEPVWRQAFTKAAERAAEQ